MKTKLLLFLIVMAPAVLAQDINMTFSSADENYTLDSITAMNIRTKEAITITGNETLILGSGTGISQNTKSDIGCLIYPNPNTGQSTLTLNISEPQDIVISVRNQLGQLIYQSKESVQTGKQSFFISVKLAGIYFVSIQHSQGLESHQIISTKNNNKGNPITYLGPQSLIPNPRSVKSQTSTNILPYIFGDPVRFFCHSGVHTTIFQDQPREIRDYQYDVSFYPCIDGDGQSYPVVLINDQIWMAENLAYISSVSPPSVEDVSEPHYYVYGYDGDNKAAAKASENCQTFGVLYNWEAAKVSCPSGWHLATDDEWRNLEIFLGMSTSEADLMESFRTSGDVGKQLKSTDLWLEEGIGLDEYGFNVLPAGWSGDGLFQELGMRSSFWTADEEGVQAIFRSFYSSMDGVWRGNGGKKYGTNVRCVKNE